MNKVRKVISLYLFSPLVFFLFLQCTNTTKNNRLIITNVTKTQKFSLIAEKNSKLENLTGVGVSGIKIIISGNIKGEAEIIARYGDTLKLKTGSINDSITGDFYSNTCPLIFIPLGSTEGEIFINYHFFKL